MFNLTHHTLIGAMESLRKSYEKFGIKEWSYEQYVWCLRELFRGEGVADAFYHQRCNEKKSSRSEISMDAIEERVALISSWNIPPLQMVKEYFDMPFLKLHVVALGLMYHERLTAVMDVVRSECALTNECVSQRVSQELQDMYARFGLIMVESVSAMHFIEDICFDQLIDPVFSDEASYERFRDTRAVLTLALRAIS